MFQNAFKMLLDRLDNDYGSMRLECLLDHEIVEFINTVPFNSN